MAGCERETQVNQKIGSEAIFSNTTSIMSSPPSMAVVAAGGHSHSSDVIKFLIDECGTCSECASLLVHIDERDEYDDCRMKNDDDRGGGDDDEASSSHRRRSCTICLGMLHPSYVRDVVLPLAVESLSPYLQLDEGGDDDEDRHRRRVGLGGGGGARGVAIDRNAISRESPTVVIPRLVAVRAHVAIECARRRCVVRAPACRCRDAEEVRLLIRDRLRSSLRAGMLGLMSSHGASNDDDDDVVNVDDESDGEEAGRLGVHVLCLPPQYNTHTPSSSSVRGMMPIPPSLVSYMRDNINEILIHHRRTMYPRKRYRGNDPTSKQGGDPRTNLERRTRKSMGKHVGGMMNNNRLVGGGGGEGTAKNNKRRRSDGGVDAIVDSASSHPSGDDDDHHLPLLLELIPWLEKDTVSRWIDQSRGCHVPANDIKDDDDDMNWLIQWHREANSSSSSRRPPGKDSVRVASWRRPFYVMGTYTKSRRDVSQTPFYVSTCGTKTTTATEISSSTVADNNDDDDEEKKDGSNAVTICPKVVQRNAMVRLGITSVEEEICSQLALVGCGGIAQGNNERIPTIDEYDDDRRQKDVGRGDVVYGMCKFHASGREDMDVRMLLPPPSYAVESDVSVTGRPFVCEVIDALRMPSRSDLERVVDAINFVGDDRGDGAARANCDHSDEVAEADIEWDERGWPRTLASPDRYHGSNPRGVGVSTRLVLVPSSAFSSLQSQTEEKVKCYGCVCWTSAPIASDVDLVRKLGCKRWCTLEDDADEAADFSYIYPLEINQVTPLRVLHRRSSNVRVRCILNLSACRISDHWFRLRMSTSAGTCKFVGSLSSHFINSFTKSQIVSEISPHPQTLRNSFTEIAAGLIPA